MGSCKVKKDFSTFNFWDCFKIWFPGLECEKKKNSGLLENFSFHRRRMQLLPTPSNPQEVM